MTLKKKNNLETDINFDDINDLEVSSSDNKTNIKKSKTCSSKDADVDDNTLQKL